MPTFEFNEAPLGYFVTFRAFGTWLHGDERGSVDRKRNRYGTPRIPPNKPWYRHNERTLSRPPVKLGKRRRAVVLDAIRETCNKRNWQYHTANGRTNHVHAVLTAPSCKPEVVRAALKANATRKLRETGCWLSGKTPWAGKGSVKSLWTDKALCAAIAYVDEDQGGPLP
ncbi:MAG TPA: transposase [Pyrinomonadaceae bacterium]|nr:transposase [Pyrinomonadaceae bacterium]